MLYLIQRTDNSQITPVCTMESTLLDCLGVSSNRFQWTPWCALFCSKLRKSMAGIDRYMYNVAAVVLYLIEKELPLTAAVFHTG